MNFPDNLLYAESHEWIRVEGDYAFVGISEFAQSELGDIVYVEVETVDESLSKEEPFGSIEAVKTVTDVLMPVDGEVVEFNEQLKDTPDLINKDPYGEGWLIKIKITNQAQLNDLLKAADYQKHTNH